RFNAEPLQGLADSIKEVGVLQPIVVRPAGPNGRHVLVAGERRLRAARMAGL
ncbi:MAG TPA: chromosome partitioning protein ParB, partial [Actinobacteria bacterium]|nr:chromosome partitioning protein ParB [Actinomycetota bacterium]